MHHELRTDVEIAAPIEAVGETRTDLAASPDGNPFIVSVEGRATVGERLTQGEQFSGILVRLMRRSLDTQTVAGFEAMNATLTARAEAVVGSPS